MSHRGKKSGLESCVALCLCATLRAASGAPEPGQSGGGHAPRPDIVFILADDLGWADVGFNGPDIQTPNLDRLAAAGARLESLYALPVCTPTRCALMTGRYPIRYGRQFNVLRPGQKVGLSLDERMLPEALREAGYATVHVGKWHLGDFDPAYLPRQRGFDHSYGLRFDMKRFSHKLTGGVGMQRNGEPCADEGWLTDLLTREAVRTIEQRDPAKPFFLYVAYHAPHTPLECPPSFSKPYAWLGPTRGIYAGMVTEMDEGIGRIVAAVDRANTLLVFASDNGGLTVKGDIARNDPFRAGKGSLYEGGVRVAALAAWEGRIPAGSVVTEPLHMADWYPTLLNLAGTTVSRPLPLDGRDAWPVIAHGKPSPHDAILINTVGRSGAIRVGEWKLVRNGRQVESGGEGDDRGSKDDRRAQRKESRIAPDSIELFNVARDPSERDNLTDRYPERVRDLLARLDAFEKEAVLPILKPMP